MKMASSSKTLSSTALFLSLNLIFLSMFSSATAQTCPIDTLKLDVCADLLGLVNVVVGSPPTVPCCSLIDGLADLEAAVCLCTALKANVLGINLNIPTALRLLLNHCGKHCPDGFTCP